MWSPTVGVGLNTLPLSEIQRSGAFRGGDSWGELGSSGGLRGVPGVDPSTSGGLRGVLRGAPGGSEGSLPENYKVVPLGPMILPGRLLLRTASASPPYRGRGGGGGKGRMDEISDRKISQPVPKPRFYGLQPGLYGLQTRRGGVANHTNPSANQKVEVSTPNVHKTSPGDQL